MVAASLSLAPAPAEQRMLLHCSWKEYVILRDLLDGPGLRMTYLRGALEIMSPSPAHELWKKNTARFIEHFAFVKNIELHGYGSTTFKKEMTERGAEPDECYLIGKVLNEFPDIVLEVIHTAPLLNKLDVYAPMGIAEVWVFENERFALFVLDRTTATYTVSERSALVSELDFAMLARYVVRTDTPQALREFDREIREK